MSTAAQRRGLDAPKLVSQLRGDLDWIVMKSLEKDRARRYETANGFAADIQRHLNNEPVVARPPSKLYRFQKMARRNKPDEVLKLQTAKLGADHVDTLASMNNLACHMRKATISTGPFRSWKSR